MFASLFNSMRIKYAHCPLVLGYCQARILFSRGVRILAKEAENQARADQKNRSGKGQGQKHWQLTDQIHAVCSLVNAEFLNLKK
jgi:hypothetical protein